MNILLFLETYRRPIGDPLKPIEVPSETYRRLTRLIGDLDMLYRRLTCPIGYDIPDWRPIEDRHAPSETDMPAESNRNFKTFKYSNFYIFLLIYIYWNTILGHVGFRWVSDEAFRGLRWVSDRSPIGL